MDAAIAAQDGDAEDRRPIGSIFVELGFVTPAQLDAALVVQRQTGARIGEILVDQGSMSRLDLASALAEHWEPHRPGVSQTKSYSLRPTAAPPTPASADAAGRHLEAGLAELRRSVDELDRLRVSDALADGARIAALEASAARLDDRFASLADELCAELARARADTERAVAAVCDEVRSLGGRIDELLALRHADARAARAEVEARIDEIAGG